MKDGMRSRNEPRGIALVAVLFALVLVGLFASGSFFVALEESRAGDSAVSVERARARAEGAMDSVLSRWGETSYGRLGINDSVVTQSFGALGEVGRLVVTRVGESYFLIRSESQNLLARQETFGVVRVVPNPPPTDSCATRCELTSYDSSVVAVKVWKMGVVDES